jgi:hypothetical protein
MVPFLGRGEVGKERAMKLALAGAFAMMCACSERTIELSELAGIKESLFDTETMCSYLLHKLYLLNPKGAALRT